MFEESVTSEPLPESVTSESTALSDREQAESVTAGGHFPQEIEEQPEATGQDAPDDTQEDAGAVEEIVEQKPKGVKKRIDELLKDREEARRDRDHWRELALRQQAGDHDGERQPADTPRSETRSDEPEPQPDQYPTYEDYTKAVARWEANKIIEAAGSRASEERERQRMAEEEATVRARAAKAFKEAEQKYPDFQEVAFNQSVRITKPVAALVSRCELAGDVAYYLGKNPDIAASISDMPINNAAIAIGRIEGRILAAREHQTNRNRSSAPAPISPVSGDGVVVDRDPATMSMKDYERWRKGGK
jgi:hypothetical protein